MDNKYYTTRDLQMTDIIHLYLDETKSMEEISNILGISYSTVRRKLIASNVEIRENGRGYKLLTDEEEQELAKRYLAGYTARSLSSIYGIPIKRVEKILSRMGVKKKV